MLIGAVALAGLLALAWQLWHAELPPPPAGQAATPDATNTAPAAPPAEPENPYLAVSAGYLARGNLEQALYWLTRARSLQPRDLNMAGRMLLLYDSLEHGDGARAWSDWLDRYVTSQPLPLAALARHHYLYGDFIFSLQYANLAINMQMESRGGSDAVFMRIKRDEAIGNGDPASGVDLFAQRHPNLVGDAPQVAPHNLQQAVNLGLLLGLAGRSGEAERLLEATIRAYDAPGALSDPEWTALAPAKAEALALLGRPDEALTELARVIDNGWRVDWRWSTDLNAGFNSIRDRAEFQALLRRLEDDIAAQRLRVHAHEELGAIAPPAPLPENRPLEF